MFLLHKTLEGEISKIGLNWHRSMASHIVLRFVFPLWFLKYKFFEDFDKCQYVVSERILMVGFYLRIRRNPEGSNHKWKLRERVVWGISKYEKPYKPKVVGTYEDFANFHYA